MPAAVGQGCRQIPFAQKTELEDGPAQRFDRRWQIVDHEVDGADAEQRRAVLDVMKTGLLDKKVEPPA